MTNIEDAGNISNDMNNAVYTKHTPDIVRVIDRSILNEEKYLESLLEQAYNEGLISDEELERIQYEALSLLTDKSRRYSSGDSSSIPVEKAQDIMTSNFFTISLWLKTYPNPDDAAALLQKENLGEIYKKGRKRIDTLCSAAKAVHEKLLKELIDSPNEFYRHTLEDGIKGFFKLYYPDFSAQEIHITADYPLFNPRPKLAGIEFIKSYVEAAFYENRFCAYFSSADIHRVLCKHTSDYHKIPLNIYEQVLTAAIGCAVVGGGADLNRLEAGEEGRKFLRSIFADLPEEMIREAIQKAAADLNGRLVFTPGLWAYIQESLPLITDKVRIAARENMLDKIF